MIREGTVADDPDLLTCIVELQEAERAIDPRLPPGPAMAARYLEHIRDRGRDWQGHLLVADVDGVVAGFVTVFTRVPFDEPDDPPGAYALVNDLVVRAAYRGRGLGRRLLAHAEARALEAGAVEIRIHVLAGNQAALAVYDDAGFGPHLVTLRKLMT